jgi:hypothetical protein
MGVIKQGILGGVLNKVGSIVGTSWKGIAVIKSMPLTVSNPRSAGQLQQRARMTNTVVFSQFILSQCIKPLWDRFSIRMSGYNAFTSANIAYFDAPSPFPREAFVFSRGKIAKTEQATSTVNIGTQKGTVTWLADGGQGFKLNSDMVYVVCQNHETGLVTASAEDATRADTSVVYNLPEGTVATDQLSTWLAFRRSDGTMVSNSSYSEVFNP